jgi:hypothetical protein
MNTALQSEANELLQGASRAIRTNDAIMKLQTMNEVHEALEKLIEMHPHSPYTISMCSFLLGVYMGLQYHDMESILKEIKMGEEE